MRKKTKNRHGGYGLHVLLAVLMMLVAGVTPAWAGDFDYTKNDRYSGNTYGTYRCHGSSEYSDAALSPDFVDFWTEKKLDIANGQFYWLFEVKLHIGVHDIDKLHVNGSTPWYLSQQEENHTYEGEICVVTADNVKHLIATWKKERYERKYTYKIVDDTWGVILLGHHYNTANALVYTPSTKAFEDGVKRITIKMRQTFHYNYDSFDFGWLEYEKDLDCSGLETGKPMPKLSIDWGKDGRLAVKANGVPDYREDNKYSAQSYTLDVSYYYNNSKKISKGTLGTASQNVAYSNVKDGQMDMTIGYWPLTSTTETATGAYTLPAYVNYRGVTMLAKQIARYYDDITVVPEGHTLSQPLVEYGFIKPFTRPVSVAVEFDKWGKKNTVKWTRQTSAKGYNGSKLVDVDCRYDGKWYVIRYLKGSTSNNYTLIGTLDGKDNQLYVTDENIIYGKEYVYRVIFLPSVLEEYSEKLNKLPGYNRAHDSNTDLWEEKTASTKLDVPITLSQDKTYDKDVFLKWQYSIPLQGLAWTIEYKKTGEKTWLSKTETIPVDPNQTEASAHFSGTVCDPITYRIKTSVDEDVIYSDTLSTTLPSGSYISDVTATTGTEETEVKVKWKVKNPDIVNDIYYRVLRRPIGAEGPDSWTELTSSVHGTATEYEYTDTRPLAGTYYEYTVEAFGAKCGDQLMKSDAVVTPGFSQARGTITGHISFGSGTAVAGVRVNLVKSSTDDANSQPQFLSRRVAAAAAAAGRCPGVRREGVGRTLPPLCHRPLERRKDGERVQQSCVRQHRLHPRRCRL